MAAGGTSWQYYNNTSKYQMPPPNTQAAFAAAGGDMQEMHLKMSKKIAQLTKVIYALNTKNDEHVTALVVMKEAHEEESQHLLAETASKIQAYQQKVGKEFDLRKRIQNLEEVVNAAEKEKRQAMIEFESFKRLVEEREMRLESDHSLKVMKLTRELLDCKNEFEKRLCEFHDLKTVIQNEGGIEIEKLVKDHKLELERLHAVIEEKEEEFNKERNWVVQSHSKQIQSLELELTNLRTEFKKVEEEFESKMNKSRAFYERELSVIRSKASNSDAETMKRWQQREAELHEEASKMEYTLKKKVTAAEEELRVQSIDIEELGKKLEFATLKIRKLEDSNEDLSDSLTKARSQYVTTLDEKQYLQVELESVQACLQSKESDILEKSSHIGSLEASKLTQEVIINNLEKEINNLKIQLSNVSADRDSMRNNNSEATSQLRGQLQDLEMSLNVALEEKSSLKNQLSKDIESLQQTHFKNIAELKEKYDNKQKSVERDYKVAIDRTKAETKNVMDGMLHDMQERLQKETAQLIAEKTEVVEKVESEKEEIFSKLQLTQNELMVYQNLLHQHEDDLGNATAHINSLKSQIGELQQEIEISDGRLRTSEASITGLQKEMEMQAMTHAKELSSLQQDHAIQMEKKKAQLDSEWQQQLRAEITDLQSHLFSQHRKDKHSALEEIQSRKDRELEVAKMGWQDQISQQTSLISELKAALEQQQKDSDRALAEERSSFLEKERELREAANDAANEYSSKISHMDNAHRAELTSLESRKDQEIRSVEANLLLQHREEQQSQMQAHRLAIDGMKEEMDHKRQRDVTQIEQEYIQKLDQLRDELIKQHTSDMDCTKLLHEQKLAQTQSHFEKAMEATRRVEANLTKKVCGLEEDIKQKAMFIRTLELKIAQQGEEIINLNREIDCKGQEILRVRSEANGELRRREDELISQFQRQQDMIEADYLCQKQTLVTDFNRAADLLNDKISSLDIALREAEDRYERRESRPEDLHAIRELKSAIQDKESQIQKLLDDKKFYQLELVNRETNFNKVFSTSPNVGVINPLSATQKKKNDKALRNGRFASQFVNVPNMSTLESVLSPPNRLGPIKSGHASPSTSSTSGISKNFQPTPPPPRPKKFIR